MKNLFAEVKTRFVENSPILIIFCQFNRRMAGIQWYHFHIDTMKYKQILFLYNR